MMNSLTRCSRRAACALSFVLVLSSLAAAQANPPRPYKAHLVTTTTSVTPLSPTTVEIAYVASGNGTHVGNYSEVGSYVVDLTTFTFAGSGVVTAADGSTFSVTIAGGFTGATTLAGTVSIVSGTGRFTGATGSLNFTGVQFTPVNIDVKLSGSISF